MRRAWMVSSLVLFGVAAVAVAACSDDEDDPTGPAVTCAPTDPACPAVGVGTECLGLVDNSGQDRFALRLSQLSVTSPAALTTQLVAGIVGDGVYINLDRDACNVAGMGTFNFIVEMDKTAATLTLGGAYPEQDPTNGYCYVYDPANEVEPITIPYSTNPDGSFSTDAIEKLTVPVFIDLSASQVVFLPLRQARILDAELSADQNCVGRFNADGLEPRFNCAPTPEEGINYFVDGGSLEGYITLEEADAVTVDLLGQSLCVLLSGDADMYGDGDPDVERCARDTEGNIVLQGDWCAETNSAGGCQDAFVLQATVAASSAELRSDCEGDPTGSGGGGMGGAGGSGAMGGAGGMSSGGSGGT